MSSYNKRGRKRTKNVTNENEQDLSAYPGDEISSASLDAINRMLTEPLKRYQFVQPRRPASIQKNEVAIINVNLLRRQDARKHLPYDNVDFGQEQILRTRNVFYRPLTNVDEWVWGMVESKMKKQN